ncbi:MAG TPA: VOC family protein [Baekduia sp.]|jgi:catechol 2,3-dioxygenase-like lactoylglutathione lyase family enzyme|nr:VOC family protein [Baekduia sp.]
MFADARVEATVPALDLERAARFYGEVLDLPTGGSLAPRTDLLYELGGGSALLVYEWAGSPPPHMTFAHFVVDDVAGAVRELRERGVVFDDYDLPELKTVDGVATIGEHHFAWFRDLDDNVLGIRD